MKATELRIGNLIRDVGESSEIYQVTSISHDSVKAGPMTIYRAGFEHDHYIPLTEEWLKRFGCSLVTEWGDGNYNYWNQQLDFSVDVEPMMMPARGVETLFYYRLHEQYRRKHIMYLHQLQNLYFALTGNELELK
jgi:hypothetical protein